MKLVELYLNAKIAWLSGIRGNTLRFLLIAGGLLLGVAILAGQFSLRQPLIVALDIGISGLRLLGLMITLFWMQEVFAKDIEKRTITFALAYPISRGIYVLGRFLGVMSLVFLAITVWGTLVFTISQVIALGDEQPFTHSYGIGSLVLVGIFLDLIVIGSVFVLILSVTETSMIAFMVAFFFSISARSIGVMIEYLSVHSASNPEMAGALLPVLNFIRWFIPDLSRLDWRDVVLYGNWPSMSDIFFSILLAIGYAAGSIGFAILMYRKRGFC